MTRRYDHSDLKLKKGDGLDIDQIRKKQFPELAGGIYFSTCVTGVPPMITTKAANEFVMNQRERAVKGTCGIKNEHEEELEKEAGKLINAEKNEIALIRSTTEGLSTAAGMINWRDGDNVIVNDLEFVSNVIPWSVLKDSGVEVRVVENQKGRLPISEFEEKIDDKTKVLAISSTQECNGFRCDLEELGKLCDDHDTLFVVDAIQQVGAVHLDVKKAKVDILAAGGHKWLLSPYGLGIFYVSKNRMEEFEPILAGWHNVTLRGGMDILSSIASSDWTPIQDWIVRRDSAECFTSRSVDVNPGVPALWTSIKFINKIGVENIEKRIFKLNDLLIKNLPNSVEVISPLEKEHRSGITTLKTDNDKEIVKKLKKKDVIVSAIYAGSGVGGVRLSINFYNTAEEVLGFCNEIDSINKAIRT